MVVKLIYKPVGILCGMAAGFVAKQVFDALWGVVDAEQPPSPTTRGASWSKVLGAAAVEGVAFTVTRAAVDRAGAKGFYHVFGLWPGEEPAQEQ